MRFTSVAIAVLAGCASSKAAFEERRLGRVPDGVEIHWADVSPDGAACAWVEQRPDGTWVVCVNGRPCMVYSSLV